MFKITILTIAIFRVTTITKIIMITNQLKLKGYSKEPNEHISAVVAMFKITIRVITIAKIIMIRTRTDLKLERHSKEADEHVSSGEVGDEQVGWLALQTPELSNLSSLVKCSNVQMLKCSNAEMFKC